jgi:hypothetical protein
VSSGAARVGIESVEIAGDSVIITTSTEPGPGAVVRYAFTSGGEPMPNGTARWGNLRDSDPFEGTVTGTAQPNYAVAFEMTVP